MKVRGLYTAHVVRGDAEMTLRDAARRMHQERVGSLPVFSEGQLIGILTEGDVVAAVTEGVDLDATQTGEYMTPHPVTIDIDEDSMQVARTMPAIGVRHLPVCDGDVIVGVISTRDLAVLEAWEPPAASIAYPRLSR